MKDSNVLWLPGILLCASGALMIFLSPPGEAFVGWTGVALCCSGGLLFAVAYYLGQDRCHRRNLVLVALGIACAAAAFVAFAHVILYATSRELPRSGLLLALSAFGLAACAAGAVYSWRYHINDSLLDLAAGLGLAPADSGLTRPDGRYDLRGTFEGVEMLLDGTDYEANRGTPHSVALDIKCKVANTGKAWVAAYPGSVLKRPLGPLPPKVEGVPYWDWHSVHSEPPDAAERILGTLRASPETAFQDKYGFYSLEVKDGEALCRFSRTGYFSAEYVRHLMAWSARLAALVK